MFAYILRRLLLIPPTVLGILLVSFLIVQFAPGGPVERVIAQLTNDGGAGEAGGGIEVGSSKYRGAQGLDPAFIKSLEKQFGFDKPPAERFLLMLKNYLRFDFGESFFTSRRPSLRSTMTMLPIRRSGGEGCGSGKSTSPSANMGHMESPRTR